MRIKFKKLMQSEGPLMPKGYRLATVQDIINNIGTFKIWGLPIKTKKCSYDFVKLYRYKNIRLLDGWMTARFDREFQLQEAFNNNCYWKAVVKEKEWDNHARKWRTKCSALYSVDGNSLRKQIYDGITLSPQGIAVAWVQACFYNDAEVLYWLWQTTDPIDSEAYLAKFEFQILRPVMEMVQRLRSGGPKYQVRLENDIEAHTALEGAIKSFGSYAVAMIELFIEIYGTPFVDAAAEFTFRNVESISIFIKLLSEYLHKLEDQISTITKLLSVSLHQLGNQFTNLYASLVQELEKQIPNIKSPIAEVFIEAVERGYRPLAETLLELKDDISHITTDDCVWALREAVCKGYLELVKSLLDLLKMRHGLELPVEVDEEGKTLFYYVLLHADVFGLLVITYGNSITDIIKKQDKFGRNILHWAAKGSYDPQVMDHLLDFYSGEQLFDSRDDQGRTPLHIAASKGDLQMIEILLSALERGSGTSKVKEYVKIAESFGRTALHIAAGKGYVDLVRMLIDKGSDPLKERDVNRKTALHHAAQAKDADAALATCKVLLEEGRPGTSPAKRTLLLWASPAGIGTAEEMKDVHPSVKMYLEGKKNALAGEHLQVEEVQKYCLKTAAVYNNAEIAMELIDRGADKVYIFDEEWRSHLNFCEKQSVDNVILQVERQSRDKEKRHMERMKEQVRDHPSLEDKLGRQDFAQGLAALFLNRLVESPITVGIFGEWGMGKSSLMIQTENILLFTAAQLAFPHLLPFDKAVAEKISLSKRAAKMYQSIKRGIKHESKEENSLVSMLNKYQPDYRAVYKSLACMDNDEMLQSNIQQLNPLRRASRILTIQYNAWLYSDKYEAWAGLGVSISREIEKAMTRAQRLSTCWRYTWAIHRADICIQVFLPGLLSIFLAGWVVWIVWMFLKQAKFKDLLYGSIPFTVIAILWVVLKSVVSVVQPVSTQMMGYIASPDHTSGLGYQQKVIDDIKFLKKELGRKPHRFFSFILGEWCGNWFGLYSDIVENTSVPKFMPASEDQTRIITFVDDLDRCEEKVILQVLSAINLVLAECKINVVIGMDKKMIERAIRKKFKDTDDKDIAEKFMYKIIQIPLSLPDPTQQETLGFLEHHLGYKVPTGIAVETCGDTQIGSMYNETEVKNVADSQNIEAFIEQRGYEEDAEEENDAERHHGAVLNIEHPNEVQPRVKGIIEKAVDCFGCLFEYGYAVFCNIPSDLRKQYKSKHENLHTLTSSEGIWLTSESLWPNYTAEQASLFYKLASFATDYQKHPREWRHLLTYHKFSWIVLYRRGELVNCKLPTWQVELVCWIFVCWQWKHEMNFLIKSWRKYTVKRKKEQIRSAPRLSQIVTNCVSGLSFSEEGTSENNWLNLQEALKIQDVSMQGIQMFQKFRLHCETDHLEWLPWRSHS